MRDGEQPVGVEIGVCINGLFRFGAEEVHAAVLLCEPTEEGVTLPGGVGGFCTAGPVCVRVVPTAAVPPLGWRMKVAVVSQG